MLRRLGIVAVILAMTTLAPPASADDANDLIARGLDLREKGKDDEALALFKKAQEMTPSPRARAQVALAEQALGMWALAESDLNAALADKNDAWITKNRAPLEGALATVRKHLGTIEVRGTDGADVFLDGVKIGTLPAQSFRAEAGTKTLEVRAKGFQSTTRIVDVPAGGIARETVTLAALPAGDAPDKAPVIRDKPIETTADPGRGQRLLGWVFLGAGGASLAGGVASLLIRQNIISDYNDQCPGVGAAAQTPDCNDKVDSASTWKTISIVTFVAGGALALGGITLIVTAPKAEKTAFGCTPSIGGVMCAGRF